MRIRKIKSTRNEYIYAGGVWIRNFTKWGTKPVNESCMIPPQDQFLVVKNEFASKTLNLGNIAEEKFSFANVVIVSDGYQFVQKAELLRNLPANTAIIATNGALKKWPLMEGAKKRILNFYVVNNPYEDCMYFMPRRYFPTAICSSRTHLEFLKQYGGMKYIYDPTPERDFGFPKEERYYLDDYRNPICAAMGMAYRFGASKVMLFCCDDSFSEEKSAAVKLENGLWTYPQHLRSHEIIDANAYWLKTAGIRVGNYSSGPKSIHAEYITGEEQVKAFFEEVSNERLS